MMQNLAQASTLLLALVFSIGFHEAAHAYAASAFGDRTAAMLGRRTLNPFVHLTPMGTLLPVGLVALGVPLLIGWGKPVPVDSRNVRYGIWGEAAIALAGPAANLLICFFCIAGLMLQSNDFSMSTSASLAKSITSLLQTMIGLNAMLAVFNLLPFDPLDGATILRALLPGPLRDAYEDYVAPYGLIIFLVLMFSRGLSFISALADGYITFVSNLLAQFL